MGSEQRLRFLDRVAVASGKGAALSDALETSVGRFHPSARRQVRRLVRSSPRLAELASVFPGALYAIAVRCGPASGRAQAVGLIERGAPLKAVARALDVPFWLRRLPPEAFNGPLPSLPASEAFARRIANRFPTGHDCGAFWLACVAFGAKAAHEEFALWLAEQHLYGEQGDAERLFGVLAAYAWFSSHGGASRAHSLIVVPWRPEIAFDTALCAAKSWLNRMRLVLQLNQGSVTDPWLTPGSALGYTFTPLIEQSAILQEAHAMQNCADQYADRLARDKCRLFAVRRNGTSVATLEIGPHVRETGVLAITQLKARHNMPAPVEIWQAAHAWLAGQRGLKRLPPMTAPDRPLQSGVWTQILRPYRDHKGGAPWLPAVATQTAFAELDADLADLARRGCVSSWLFT